MDKLIIALAPVFAAGLAVQQLLEILTAILEVDSREKFQRYKKTLLGLVSVVLGLVLASGGYLKVLQPLFAVVVTDPATKAVTTTHSVIIPGYLDYIVTALVLSAGTEGINSILKFLKYKKEETKNEAAAKQPDNANAVDAAASHVPSKLALESINRK